MIGAVLNGFILALGLILPLGVQNLFVFNQGAAQSRYYKALPVVVTAAVCDTLLIVLVVYGLSAITLGIGWVKLLLSTAGILFLIYMGWVTWNSAGQRSGNTAPQMTSRQQISFAVSVSLLNPHAILDTIGVVGTSSLRYAGWDKAAFAIACISVSWLWFAGLAWAGRAIGRMDASGRMISLLNRVSAILMWGTAVYLAFTLMKNG